MAQLNFSEQAGTIIEKVGVLFQECGNLFGVGLIDPGFSIGCRCHICIVPSKTNVAGPVISTG
ncbi:MAG: hypothetical protein IEMM0002_0596 [bacterium]|nr:MAG: hypothetical protein IEMM0002_0596 [bacterium]